MPHYYTQSLKTLSSNTALDDLTLSRSLTSYSYLEAFSALTLE